MKSVVSRVTTFRQQLFVALITFASFFLLPIQAHAADLGNTAKSAGSKAISLLLIFTLVIAAVVIVLGILSWTTNISWLAQVGTKKIFIGGGGLIAALSFAMLFTWLYQTMTSAGGGMGFNWPF